MNCGTASELFHRPGIRRLSHNYLARLGGADNPQSYHEAILRLLNTDNYKLGALRFSQKYATFNLERQIVEMSRRIEEMC